MQIKADFLTFWLHVPMGGGKDFKFPCYFNVILSGLTCQMKCFPKLLDIFHISICKRLIEDIWKVEVLKKKTTTWKANGQTHCPSLWKRKNHISLPPPELGSMRLLGGARGGTRRASLLWSELEWCLVLATVSVNKCFPFQMKVQTSILQSHRCLLCLLQLNPSWSSSPFSA